MEDYKKILNKYWGYSNFRPLQEEIIESVAAGKDTLALLPTGGGKSVTYQIPFVEKDGLTIVITPLIALMNDQVANLKKRGIKALAIHSGLSKHELMIAYDNCIFGNYKFLYLSPERLGSPVFLAKLEELKVNLIAVDEAHCISQWGYDFRPAYLKLAEIREKLEGVPVLALTATATYKVADDIQERLLFPQKNTIRQSFERKNLVYWVHHPEDKISYLKRLLKQQPGSAIVYVRSRKKAKEIAQVLNEHEINAGYYHAGLSSKEREEKQGNWQSDQMRVMVSTNAFGMGIDKPDVRLVVHWEIPDSPEAYFQEAGRAGRDGKKAFAVLMYHPSDKKSLNQALLIRFPEIKKIKEVYQALGHYFQIIPGSGKGQVFEFNLQDFSSKFGLHSLVAYHSIKHLERAGYLDLTEEIDMPSRVLFRVNRDDLYKFQIGHSNFDGIIKLLLRLYSGLFSDFVPINEYFIAKKAGVSHELIERVLTNLNNQNILYYLKPSKYPRIIYSAERLDEKSLIIPVESYEWKKNESRNRLDTMLHYAESSERCRSQLLLMYFGEKDPFPCKHCDVCKGSEKIDKDSLDRIKQQIVDELRKSPLDSKELVLILGEDEKLVDIAITELLELKKLKIYQGRLSIS